MTTFPPSVSSDAQDGTSISTLRQKSLSKSALTFRSVQGQKNSATEIDEVISQMSTDVSNTTDL